MTAKRTLKELEKEIIKVALQLHKAAYRSIPTYHEIEANLHEVCTRYLYAAQSQAGGKRGKRG